MNWDIIQSDTYIYIYYIMVILYIYIYLFIYIYLYIYIMAYIYIYIFTKQQCHILSIRHITIEDIAIGCRLANFP